MQNPLISLCFPKNQRQMILSVVLRLPKLSKGSISKGVTILPINLIACASYIIHEAQQSHWKYPQANHTLLDRPPTTIHRKTIRINQKKRGLHRASLHALLQRSLFGGGGPSGVSVRSKRKGVHRPDGRHLLHEHRPLASPHHQNIPNRKIKTLELILALHPPLPRRIRRKTVQGIG